jgi:hypothetical protein
VGMRSSALFGSSLLVVALAAASSLVACSSPATEQDSVAEGRATRQTKKGAEFARCWTTNDGTVDLDFRVYTLSCRVSSAGLKGLETSAVSVDARTVKTSVQSASPGATPDQDVIVGRFYKSDFPLSATVYGYWKLGEFTSTDYRTQVAIADTVTADQPVIVKLPFDSWEVTLLNRLPQAAVSSERYEVQAAPFITEASSTSTKTTFITSAQTPFLAGVPRLDLDVIVPQSGSLTLSLAGLRSPSSTTLSGPGVFVLDANGIRKATAAEEAEADNADAGPAPAVDAGPAPATDAGPGPSTDAGDAGTPDASDASTTCGNNGQATCKNASNQNFCNAGARFDNQTYKCVSCGNNGETYCYDRDPLRASGAMTCNATTRFDNQTYKCVTCGNDGQTYCYGQDPNNQSGQMTCNAGTRFDNQTYKCVACGNAGQTYCYSDPSNAKGSMVCNAPATFNSFTYKCQ